MLATMRPYLLAVAAMVARVFYRLSRFPVIGPICLVVVHMMGRKQATLANISDHAKQSFLLCGAGPSHAVTPQFPDKVPTQNDSQFKAIYAHQLDVSVIGADSSCVTVDDRVLVPSYSFQHRARIPVNMKTLGYADRNVCFLAPTAHQSIDTGVLISGDGGSNWYHFLIECLPKAYLARHLPPAFQDFPLIVPEECDTIPNFAAALSHFAQGRPVFAVPAGHRVRVRNLITIDDIVHAPFNLYPGLWPDVSDYAQHDECLQAYFADFRDKLGLRSEGLSTGRRIFLARPGFRRSHNQDELIGIARRFGFEPVSPEKLPLKEQAQLFADASCVIGASGAAWANMIFARKSMKALSWLFPEYSGFSTYATLASLQGVDMRFVYGIPEKSLPSTGHAYTARYSVSAEVFERALIELLEDD